ncbi:MAG: type II secretion system protein [Phycisphaerales bacterium]
MNAYGRGRCRGFTLIEVLVVIAVIALLVAILLPALGEARQAGRKAVCQSNLHQFGIAYQNYASDFKDNMASFTWRGGVAYTMRDVAPDSDDPYSFPAAGTDNQAAANQAVAILRHRADRRDINQIPVWIPHILYSHLVLNDYLQQRLPEKMVACPGDRVRNLWQDAVVQVPGDPNGPFWALAERPGGMTNSEKRWPYSSSYTLPPSYYSADRGTAVAPTISQAAMGHRWYNTGNANTRLGKRKYSEVSFPQNKAMMYDNYGHHQKRSLFYAYPEVTQPILFADTSVNERTSRDCNNGWDPNSGTRIGVQMLYVPELSWEPPTRSGAPQEYVEWGNQQWTQLGLHGVDWGMEEAY